MPCALLRAQDDFEAWKKLQKNGFDNYSEQQKKYSEQQKKEFSDYRNKVNAEFADFMRKEWESFQAFKGIPTPTKPKPVAAPQATPERQVAASPIPFKEIQPLPMPTVPRAPLAPIPPASRPTPAQPTFSFTFYNTVCKVSLDASQKFTLRNITENSVADAWKTLSDSRYNDLLNDCLNLREELNLCDWGYIEMLKALSEKFFGKPCNEAVLLQMYILTQSGYKVRIARVGERLALLVPFQQTVYEYTYVPIQGQNYVMTDKSIKGGKIFLLNHEFPKEQQASLQPSQPNFPIVATPVKEFVSKRYPDLHLSISTNKNLLDFYNTYPRSEWNLYVAASLSETLKQELYPTLKQKLSGKSEKEAVNILINFVQTAFEYKTDEEQFGAERPLFADETFFYPYSDCEDRSILFSILVKELLHLDVILLNYPNHLATAVCFQQEVTGDYLTIEGKTYIICDPTYIGADIGNAMPQYQNTPAKVIRL
ncbi:hypothetical protein FACS1894199_11270 [Bacteroidia bacterium]|nr:hypothetical protein FACS1894199_11270 [Bacteroidia bacterium]